MRKILDRYTHATQELERIGAAVLILESCHGCEAALKVLRKRMQIELKRMDKAAEELGAPYPGAAHD